MKSRYNSIVQGLGLFVGAALLSFTIALSALPEKQVALAAFEHCSNNIDDDVDGAADCQDSFDCALATNCPENCTNQVDDDGDGLVDCDDHWCAWQDPVCW